MLDAETVIKIVAGVALLPQFRRRPRGDFGGYVCRHDNDAIGVRNDEITRSHGHVAADDWLAVLDYHEAPPRVLGADRSCKNGKLQLLDPGNIPHGAVDDDSDSALSHGTGAEQFTPECC